MRTAASMMRSRTASSSAGRGRDLDQLLVAALDAAVPFPQVAHVASVASYADRCGRSRAAAAPAPARALADGEHVVDVPAKLGGRPGRWTPATNRKTEWSDGRGCTPRAGSFDGSAGPVRWSIRSAPASPRTTPGYRPCRHRSAWRPTSIGRRGQPVPFDGARGRRQDVRGGVTAPSVGGERRAWALSPRARPT